MYLTPLCCVGAQVGVLSAVGRRLDVSAFYISFVLAPLASNASELIASYNYAKKKTSKVQSPFRMYI